MNERNENPLGGLPIAIAPDWTNPNVGMFALIAAAYNEYGATALQTMTEGMKHLGRRTGKAMLEHKMVEPLCGPTEWGRFTHQLMDLTGMYTYEEVVATDTVYEFIVPSEAWPYHEPLKYLNAPPEVCDICADWDRGCLETISPNIVMTQPECSGRGDPVCRWHYELATHDSSRPQQPKGQTS